MNMNRLGGTGWYGRFSENQSFIRGMTSAKIFFLYNIMTTHPPRQSPPRLCTKLKGQKRDQIDPNEIKWDRSAANGQVFFESTELALSC